MSVAARAERVWLWQRSLYPRLLLLAATPGAAAGLLYAWTTLGAVEEAIGRTIGRQLAEVARDASEGLKESIAGMGEELLHRSRDVGLRQAIAGGLDGGEPSVAVVFDHRGIVASAVGIRTRPWGTQPVQGSAAVSPKAGAHSSALAGGLTVELIEEGTVPSAGVQISTPVYSPANHEEIVGVLEAQVSWEHLNFVLQHFQHNLSLLGFDADLLIVDERGLVVGGGAWDEPSPLHGLNLFALGWGPFAQQHQAGGASYLEETRAEVLVGVAPIDVHGLHLTALAVQPTAEAYAPVDRLLRRLLFEGVLILFGGALLAALVTRRISGPIKELTRAIESIAVASHKPAQVQVRGRDEIASLAQSFNRMAAELAAAHEKLVAAAKLAFAGELAASMAHEIRTPLGIMRSSAQLLGRQVSSLDGPAAELIEIIVGEADRLDRLVTGLLEISRPHAPAFSSGPLSKPLARALDFIAGQAASQGVLLERVFAPNEPPVEFDPEQIYQVVLNLLVNALQGAPRGSTIQVRTFSRPGIAGFEVRDEGPGLPAELHEKIFEPFYTARRGGMGLGLAIVRRIVHAHRGTIQILSNSGSGATFRVELPLPSTRPVS